MPDKPKGGGPPPIDLGDIEGAIGDITGDGGASSSGGSSSSGSSSSSGGGSSAPADPTVSAAASFYYQLWGAKPPMGYIEGFIRGGHDLFDFMTWQLSRPGAAKQQFYRDEFARYAAVAARTFGKR